MEGGRLETKTAVKGAVIREAKGFIFDMDGTLLSISVDWPAVGAELARISGRSNFVPIFETIKEVLQTNPQLRLPFFRVLDEFVLRQEPEARLFEGSRETLELLSRRGKIALVTMQGPQVRDKILNRFDLARFFQVLISREDSIERSEQLALAVAHLGLQKGEVVFVGDRIHDLNSAAKVGTSFVLMGERPGVNATSFPDMKALLAFLRSSGK